MAAEGVALALTDSRRHRHRVGRIDMQGHRHHTVAAVHRLQGGALCAGSLEGHTVPRIGQQRLADGPLVVHRVGRVHRQGEHDDAVASFHRLQRISVLATDGQGMAAEGVALTLADGRRHRHRVDRVQRQVHRHDGVAAVAGRQRDRLRAGQREGEAVPGVWQLVRTDRAAFGHREVRFLSHHERIRGELVARGGCNRHRVGARAGVDRLGRRTGVPQVGGRHISAGRQGGGVQLAYGVLTRDGGVGWHHIGARREIDLRTPVADHAVAAVRAHLDIVGRAAVQTGDRVGVGGRVVGVGIQVNQRDIPRGRSVVGPSDRRTVVGDIGHRDVLGHGAQGRHKDVVHIPDPVRRRGVVAEGDGRAGRCAGEGHNLPDIRVGDPIVVAVGGHGREGRGSRQIGEVAHLEGAVAGSEVVLRTQPEHHLQTTGLLHELRQGDQAGGARGEHQRILAAGGVVVTRGGDVGARHTSGKRTPAVERFPVFEVVGVRHGLRLARGSGKGHHHTPVAHTVGVAVMLCLQLVGEVGVQTRDRVGGGDFRHIRPRATSLAVAQVIGATGSPAHRDRIVRDIGNRHVIRRGAGRRVGIQVGTVGACSSLTDVLHANSVGAAGLQIGDGVRRRYVVNDGCESGTSLFSEPYVVGQT